MQLFSYAFLFHQFLTMYNKTYTYEIYTERFPIFVENIDYIANYNSLNTSVTLGMTPFTDMTPEEFAEWLGFLPIPPSPTPSTPSCPDFKVDGVSSAPASLDWRTEGVVTGVKDQGQCGSCWAFACTETAESLYALNHNATSPPVLAPQELVDCAKESYGCSGGYIDSTLQYIMTNGLETESEYPYEAVGGVCSSHKTDYKLEGCFNVPENNEVLLKEALATGPLVVCIEADERVFQLYQSGIIGADSCGTSLDHAVQLVGYGEEEGTKYWLVRNSWGEAWGENGYVRLERTDSESTEGTCGIAMAAAGFTRV